MKNKPLEKRDIISDSDPEYTRCLHLRQDLLERLAECDESFMEEYFIALESTDIRSKVMLDDPDFWYDKITAALRKACLSGGRSSSHLWCVVKGKG